MTDQDSPCPEKSLPLAAAFVFAESAKILSARGSARNLAVVLGGLCCVLLLASCASSKRAMRISPFSEMAGPVGTMSEERVNLWPLAYHQPGATSVLWPVVDMDEQGFAIRPLFNKERDDYSVLFPLCAWNPRDGEGWLLSGYWDNGAFGVAPLFHRGDDFQYWGPVWWQGRDEVKRYGLFPLAAKGRDLSYAGLLWKKGKWGDPEVSAGVFPLACWQRGSRSWIFPLYSQRDRGEDGGRLTVGLGALAYLDRQSADNYTRWIAPGYFARREGEERLRLALPLSYSFEDGNRKTSLLAPFYLYQREGDESMLVTPLGGRAWSGDGTTTMRNLLGPLYHWHHSEKETYSAFLWPLLTSRHHRESQRLRLSSWPAGTFWQSDARGHSLFAAFGAYYEKIRPERRTHAALWGTQKVYADDDAVSWHLWPLAGVKRHDDGRLWDPLYDWNLINSYRSGEERAFYLTPLFGYGNYGKHQDLRAIPLAYRMKSGGRSAANFLLLGGWTSSPEWRQWYFLPFAAGASGEAHRGGGTGIDALAFFSRRQDPRIRSLKLGWGALYHDTVRETEKSFSRDTGVMMLCTRSNQTRDRELALDDLAERSSWWGGSSYLERKSLDIFPVLFTDRTRSLQTPPPARQRRQLIQRWTQIGDANRRENPRQAEMLERRLLAVFKASLATAPAVAGITSETPAETRNAAIRAAIAADVRATCRDVDDRTFHIPLLFKHEKGSGWSSRSLLLLWHARDRRTPAGDLLANWSASAHRAYLGETESRRRTLFPVWFAETRKTLLVDGIEDRVMKAADVWSAADDAYTHFAASSGAQRGADLAEKQALLLDLLHGVPEIADAVKVADTATDRDGQAVAIHDALGQLAALKSSVRDRSTTRIPLLWKSERQGDKHQWRVLMGAVQGARTGDESRTSVLRYLYRREKSQSRIYRDFFPFFTWNSAPEKGDFAFFWRVFHLRREGDSHSGHLLFIPF